MANPKQVVPGKVQKNSNKKFRIEKQKETESDVDIDIESAGTYEVAEIECGRVTRHHG